MVLLTLLAAVTIGVVRTRNLFGVIVLAGIYSFLMASVLIVLDAVDVAMTEAAVGAGVSTVLLLATLHLTKSMEYPQPAQGLSAAVRRCRHRCGDCLGNLQPAALRDARQRHPQARRAPLPG